MPTVGEIYQYLQQLAPLKLQMDYDNSGLLLGDEKRNVSRTLLSLDVTDEVAIEAEEQHAQLILSHHPLIFHPIKSMKRGPETEKILSLIRSNIAVMSFHTNLDIAEGGVNDVLLGLLGAEYREKLDDDGCGRIGEFCQTIQFRQFLNICKERLQTNGLRFVNAGGDVKRLAVMGGSGASALRDAWEKGCDTYLTADVGYHDFLLAKELRMNLIDGDHFCTENPVLSMLQTKLQETFPEMETVISNRHCQIIQFA